MSVKRKNQPGCQCCTSGISKCGCSGVPATLNATWWFQPHSAPGTRVPVSFTLTYNPGTISFGAVSYTGYWISGCVDISTMEDCWGIDPVSGLPVQNANCYRKFLWVCFGATSWGMYSAPSPLSDSSCSGGTWNSFAPGFATSAFRCSPFLWTANDGLGHAHTVTA
jgi:hypothetical protein